MDMFEDFNISRFKSQSPPSDNSFDTMMEIKELNRIPLNKKFVKEKDDITGYFKKVAERSGIDFYPELIADELIEESAPLIMELKNHYDRPRPKVLAKKLGIDIEDIEMDSMKTASYPSGHSAQGVLIGKVLGDKYPKAKSAFAKTAKNISYSRQVARAHYKSDSVMGEKLGDSMYQHIKNKI